MLRYDKSGMLLNHVIDRHENLKVILEIDHCNNESYSSTIVMVFINTKYY